MAKRQLDQSSGPTGQSDPKKKKWVIMLYISADSTLANFAIESLKQIKQSADADVVVAAQFAIDAPAGQNLPRYVFDHRSGPDVSIDQYVREFVSVPCAETEQETFANFLTWAYEEIQADYHILILWGHGPELLLQPSAEADPIDPGNLEGPTANRRLYLTPLQLRQAFQAAGIEQRSTQSTETAKKGKRHLDIVGFDACSMGMLEVAYEIRAFADYMVASQDDVPDLSFPYDSLVRKIQNAPDPRTLSIHAVDEYVRAYQDYIYTPRTDMNQVTLSAIDLERLDDPNGLGNGLQSLAAALLKAQGQGGLDGLIIRCRASAQGFACGLYVDLFGFCDELRGALSCSGKIPKGNSDAIIDACDKICTALQAASGCILANRASNRDRCHGLSLYFPYLSEDDRVGIQQPLVKGGNGTLGGKGIPSVLNEVACNILLCFRRQLIKDTEGYYGKLALSVGTEWSRFIRCFWSCVLAQCEPTHLDLKYSAQQCAINLCSCNCPGKPTVKEIKGEKTNRSHPREPRSRRRGSAG